ncbi:hypothetical protein O181_106795 [Austropuccinia psidii MF-1]|uniref:Uncharacterized protein n=1 Tax=Austropuccinia psidii MF-1 TaxID=1389203 RepID=A0A9Q3PN08_9BASI|nr:hypothetical protein [Austropuccinia psidii MF-1]
MTISMNSHNSFSSAATTIPNLGSNPIAAIAPFPNMFLDSKVLSSPAMPSWVQSKIPTLPFPPMISKLKINFGYYCYLFDTKINHLGPNMHLFFGMAPPVYDTFCNAHDIIMELVLSIVL